MDDYLCVRCDDYREALSARLDGEDPGMDPAWVEAHLASCAGCRAWLDRAAAATRAATMEGADDVPDLTDAILTRASSGPDSDRVAHRTRRTRVLRVGLFAVAAGQWAAALGVIFAQGIAALPVHGAHELGSFNLAVAVGFAWIAWRPSRAGAYLPLLGALVGVLAALTGADLVMGHASPRAEAPHLLLVAGLVLTAMLARADRAPGGPAVEAGETGPDGVPKGSAKLPRPRGARPRHAGATADTTSAKAA